MDRQLKRLEKNITLFARQSHHDFAKNSNFFFLDHARPGFNQPPLVAPNGIECFQESSFGPTHHHFHTGNQAMRESKTFPEILIGLKTLLRQSVPLALLGLLSATSLAIAIFPDAKDLVRKLKSSDPDTRRGAAKELGELGPDASEAVPALANALKDNDKFVRRFAAQSLAKMGDAAKPAREPLAAILKNPAEVREVQEAAAQALANAGKPAVPALADAVKNNDLPPSVRTRAADSLGQIGKDAVDAVPALTLALKAQSVRLNAATALGKIGPDAKPAIEKMQEMYDKKGERDRPFKAALKDAINKINKGAAADSAKKKAADKKKTA